MIAVLYVATAAVVLWLADRFVMRMSRAAAIALILLPLCPTGRAVFTGQAIAPIDLAYMTPPLSDYAQDMGTANVKNPILGDVVLQMMPWREAVRRSMAAGEWPLLNPYQQCGDDLAGSAQAAPFSPVTLLALLLPTAVSFTFTAVITFLFAGIGMFALARSFSCSETAALAAAAIFSFSAPIIGQVLWPLGIGWALMPLLLAAIRGRNPFVIAIVIALELLSGHPETALHVGAVAMAMLIFEWNANRDVRAIVMIGCAAAVAALLTAIAWLPMLDAVHQSGEWIVRTWYAKAPLRIAPGFVEAAALTNFLPFVRPQYRQFLLPRGEAGSIALVLALAAVWFFRGRREVQFFALLGFLAFFIGIDAWPFANIMHSLPLFDRALNDRLIAVLAMAIAMLAAFAIDEAPAMATSNVAAAAAVILFGAAIWFRDIGPIYLGRSIADVVPLAIAAIVIAFVRRDIAAPALVALIVAQRMIGDASLLPVYAPRTAFPDLPVFQPLKQVREPFRVVASGSLFLPNLPTMYGLEDVRASTPVTFAPFADTYPLWLERRGFGEVNDLTKPILSMMNVRYAFTTTGDAVPSGWRDVAHDRATRLVENTNVLPRAFVPRLVRFGRAPDQQIAEMKDETDFAGRAWIDALQPSEIENGRGHVVTQRIANGLRLDAEMESAAFVVVSQSAWRGWRMYLDGRAVRPLRANHAFLAVHIPAGRHVVILRFLPQAFVTGRAISMVSLVLFVSSIVIVSRRRRVV